LIDKIRGGGTPSTQNPEYWDGPLPWVSPKDMKSTYISKTQDYVTNLALTNSVIELVSPNSILIVVRSGILKHTLPVCINSVPVTINQDLKALTLNSDTEAKFLRYVLKAYEKEVLNFCSKIGATVDSIEIEELLNFMIVLPPRAEQEKISIQLDLQVSSIDAVVQAVKKVIAKLQEYRAALITSAVTGQIDVRAAVTAEAA
jgi:restriction endonuclease S subunit